MDILKIVECDKYEGREHYEKFDEAASPEHVENPESGFMTNWSKCSCGWESNKYWDGRGYARTDWERHVQYEIGITPRKCPCGKKYTLLNGERPCHKLIEI